MRITVQVLNGSTGEVREIVANVQRDSEQDAVNLLFTKARKDDYYYRFLGMHGVIEPVNAGENFSGVLESDVLGARELSWSN